MQVKEQEGRINMRHLLDCWDKLKQELNNRYILLLLDYDGTLTPIAEAPEKAVLSPEIKDLLERLTKISRCRLAIISGRALVNIKKMVGLKGVIYAGNHGLEIEGPKLKFISPGIIKSRQLMRKIKEDLVQRLKMIDGVAIEDKGLTLSLHYRKVEDEDLAKVKNIFDEVTRPDLIKKKIKVTSGKKVFEIRPNLKWDKGKVALWLFAREQFITGIKSCFPIYIGDDVTDEDAFRALKNKGITVFVGRPKVSDAQYYLRNTKEVFNFLEQFLSR